MAIITRSAGSPWKKSAATIQASSSLVVTDLPGNTRSVDLLVTAYNTTEDKVKSFHYRLAQENGSLKSTVSGRIGSLKLAITEAFNAGDIEVTLTNNETFDIEVETASLILGG